jgi:hypothetical protein
MNDPEFNYAYKSSEAQMISRYIGFGYNIGAGTSFNLENYYKLGDEVVAALKEHPRLLEKHFSCLDEKHYVDNSLHLLAFDIMYCSRAYNFYKGLVPPENPSRLKKQAKVKEISSEELLRLKTERIEKIASIEEEIADLELSIDGCEEISLVGVEVVSSDYGVGTITEQNINMITVAFADTDKKFKLDKRYTNRPRFEDDNEIIEAFTKYGNAQEKISELKKKKELIEKQLI